ncbi:MAG: hypothetical protein IKW04_01930 [Clostridia bacterium]|nr:hypothetical protein [Clostridia bacterium]
MNFLARLLYKLSHFMQGRYGIDGLCIPILVVSCVFTFFGTLFGSIILRLIGSALLILLVCRSLSKNHAARQKELYAYYNLKNKFTFRNKTQYVHQKQKPGRNQEKLIRKEQKAVRKEQKKFKCYFKCPECKAELSVPKGKGKIQITCRKCGHKFIKKT